MEAVLIDLIILGLVFWVGFTLGKRIAVIRIIANIAEDPEHLGRVLDEFRAVRQKPEDSAESIDVVVERHGDQLYLYDAKDNEFLGQGASLELALAAVNLRYPDRKYRGHITREQADALGIKN